MLGNVSLWLGIGHATMTSSGPLNVLSTWSDHFAKRDCNALAALYREDAVLYGSSDSLLSGRDAIRDYFAALPAEGSASARFDDLVIVQLSGTTAAVAGMVHFLIGATLLTVRITLTFVEDGGVWRIGMHHASTPGMLSNVRR